MQTNVRLAQKRALLRTKKHGTPLRLEWSEWSSEPLVDVTSGSTLSSPGTARAVDTLAMIHTVKPTTGHRLFGQIQVGDMIVDLLAPLKRIVSAGVTALTPGQVYDMFTFLKANRALPPELKAAATDVDTSALKNVVVTINGEKWTQQDAGDELVKMWDATFAGVKISQSLLLRRSA